MIDFENKPKIGIGSFTATEIADILNISYSKVHRWMNVYWDGKLGKEFGKKYSWVTDGKRAVSFHTFVEFYVMMQFSEAGVKPKEVINAHIELSKMFDTPFPFALRKVLDKIDTDRKRIFIDVEGSKMTLDGSKQFNLDLIKIFFKKLDFNSDNLASKYYPLGKEKSILVDPERKFGHPVFKENNIFPEVLYQHYKAGDPVNYLAVIFKVSEDEVYDAISYCERNTAA